MTSKPFRSATKVPFASLDEGQALILDKLIEQRPSNWLRTVCERVEIDIEVHYDCDNFTKAGHVQDWLDEVRAWAGGQS